MFDVDLPTYAVTNAALVQTMPLRSDPAEAAADRRQLKTGANRMLTATTDAFSFLFPVDGGVRVVPAAAIRAYTAAGPSLPESFPDEFYLKSLGRFVEDIARCFIGDHDLVPATCNIEGWEETRQAYLDTDGRARTL